MKLCDIILFVMTTVCTCINCLMNIYSQDFSEAIAWSLLLCATILINQYDKYIDKLCKMAIEKIKEVRDAD